VPDLLNLWCELRSVCELHIPFVFTLGKYGYEAEWAARQTGTFWKKENSLFLVRSTIPIP
jgi:hypothetical protein